MKRFLLAAALALTLSACGPDSPLPAAEDATFDPIAFFTGRSHGEAKLDKLGSSPVRVTVDSLGRRRRDSLVLDQIIREGGKPPRVRRWTMRRVGSDSFKSTLTDADGPVQVWVHGPRAMIAYTMKNGMAVNQQLALQPDGRTVLNRLKVSKFGVDLAVLEERIAKADQPQLPSRSNPS
ncbi:DUF3833 domain-containing protein [Sphingomonas sinipercae]|uniref:DUF3833 domain-containing protein n=1 Tax=Sphingomonas sinipercae TaxID=2714944 RepID=A0A6G7ZKB5_9SPHN|nr:DUF3833 family protein [Sphingomonas sinipercae]QIL01437.1 DUF3833 domain-containing protein [Sphingomonas sinipercae]